MLSVIFSTLNELKLGFLEKNLVALSQFGKIEIIVIDGGSTDGTAEMLEQKESVKFIQLGKSSRAQRMNAGIKAAQNQLILLHHPRSTIESGGIEYLISHHDKLTWGGFTHRFDESHFLLAFTSWYSNEIRAKRRGIIYLDHCIFSTKELLEQVGLIPEIEIFEDTEISLRLKKIHHPQLLPFNSTTSAIRFKTRGVYKQALLNQLLKLAYILKFPNKFMNRFYEKGQFLNNTFDD